MKNLTLSTIAALVSAVTAQAAVTFANFTSAGTTDAWSDTSNWNLGNVPDTNVEVARLYNATNAIIVNGNYTINSFLLEANQSSTYVASLNGPLGTETLTIDNVTVPGTPGTITTGYGIRNNSVNGETLRINNIGVTIAHSSGPATATKIFNSGGTNNTILFDVDSTLTINSLLDTTATSTGEIKMNGTVLGSANLRVYSNNLIFGNGHDSTGFGADIVLFDNSKLDIRGGDALSSNRKIQVNGTNAQLVLQFAANSYNGNLSISADKSLSIDINSRQENVGFIVLGDNSALTLDITDLDPTKVLGFANSSSKVWGSGSSITIAGFQEGVIRFGNDGTGLTAGQLALIDGGAYTLSSTGFLTAVPEPSTFALIAGFLALALILIRRRRA